MIITYPSSIAENVKYGQLKLKDLIELLINREMLNSD